MILADLFEYTEKIQLAYKGQKMPPKSISELEQYAYCPILRIEPGVHIGKPTIRVFIDNELSTKQLREIKQNGIKEEVKYGTNK